MVSLESKIASFRSRNPLQPIPFELFPEFCQCWIQDCNVNKEAVFSKQNDTKLQMSLVKNESKVSETKTRKHTKSKEKVKLSGTIRLYGRISEDFIKLDRGLKMLEMKMDLLEPDVKKLKALSEVMSRNTAKYARPSVMKIAQKVTELEQIEKELLNVALIVNEDEI